MALKFIVSTILVSAMSNLSKYWWADGVTKQLQESRTYNGILQVRSSSREPTLSREATLKTVTDEWIVYLPKYLWELGANDAQTSKVSGPGPDARHIS